MSGKRCGTCGGGGTLTQNTVRRGQIYQTVKVCPSCHGSGRA